MRAEMRASWSELHRFGKRLTPQGEAWMPPDCRVSAAPACTAAACALVPLPLNSAPWWQRVRLHALDLVCALLERELRRPARARGPRAETPPRRRHPMAEPICQPELAREERHHRASKVPRWTSHGVWTRHLVLVALSVCLSLIGGLG